jgi:hypothetical protein
MLCRFTFLRQHDVRHACKMMDFAGKSKILDSYNATFQRDIKGRNVFGNTIATEPMARGALTFTN